MQHYWSLSVEEQFYLCWPLLVAGLVLLALRAGVRRAAVVRAGLGVVVASLAYSVHATAVGPASAYFVTPARVWELGVGVLLAVLLADRAGEQRPLSAGRRSPLAARGLVAILVAGTTYSSATPFPGWQAALPVRGAAAVIAAARAEPASAWPIRQLAPRRCGPSATSPTRCTSSAGPWSCSSPSPAGGQRGRLDEAAVLVLSIVPARLTKALVEDRFRAIGDRRTSAGPCGSRPSARRWWSASAPCNCLRCPAWSSVRRRRSPPPSPAADRASARPRSRPTPAAPPTGSGQPVPAPAQAVNDTSQAYDRNCSTPVPFTATPGATLESVPDCRARHADAPMECPGPRSTWVPDDPLAQAAREVRCERLTVLGLNDRLCDDEVCLPVVGGVTVYSDASHLTATFATTLTWYVYPALVAAVDCARGG